MTVKEAKGWLGMYPDDAEIHSHVVARDGRGGTFEEKLLFNGSHLEEKDGRKTVYLSYGFEIGWRNSHPEILPPDEPDEDADAVMADFACLRDAVDARIALGAVAFTERAGNWTLVRDRAALTFDLVQESLKEVYQEAGRYLAEGTREFTVVYGPWTLKLQEDDEQPSV